MGGAGLLFILIHVFIDQNWMVWGTHILDYLTSKWILFVCEMFLYKDI